MASSAWFCTDSQLPRLWLTEEPSRLTAGNQQLHHIVELVRALLRCALWYLFSPINIELLHQALLPGQMSRSGTLCLQREGETAGFSVSILCPLQ